MKRILLFIFLCTAFFTHAQQLKVNPITNWNGDLGSVTFSQKGSTLFYFDRTKKTGKVIINNKTYLLTVEKGITNGYLFTGKGISIQAKNCNYADTEGGDCFYGTFPSVIITVNKTTTTLKNIALQDCPIMDGE